MINAMMEPGLSEMGVGRERSSTHNLATGEVFTRQTSYLGEQNEVAAMVEATQSKEAWPGPWYELVQGALDYNNWKTGSPEVQIYLEGQEKPITLAEYTERYKSKFWNRWLGNNRVDRVVIANNFVGENGLRPGNITLTQHDDKSRSQTLGVHGRGLKIATTAILSGRMAHKISFESWVPEIGTWYGEGVMARDKVDPKLPESLELNYKRDQSITSHRTEITVHKPNEDLCRALTELPDWFLPANPNYRFFRMGAAPKSLPNLTTVFDAGYTTNEKFDGTFPRFVYSNREASKVDNFNGAEPRRVEILDPNILRHPPDKMDFVYVDGLRLKVDGANFSQIYAFWGWANESYGNNPSRSNDSLKLEGSPRDLLGQTLTLCTNPKVFEAILDAIVLSDESFEGKIGWLNLSGLRVNAEPAKALREAWANVCQRLELPETLYITDSSESKKRADNEGKPCLYMHSYTWVDTLCQVIPGLQTVEHIFELEDKAAQEQIEKLHKQMAEQALQAKLDQLLAAQQARQEALKERGIVKVAEETGEVVKLPAPEYPADVAEASIMHLINALALNRGRIISGANPEQLILEMEAVDFDRLPKNIDELGTLGDFARSFLAIFGGETSLEIKVIKNGQGIYFNLVRSQKPDKLGNYTIEVKVGDVALGESSLIRLETRDLLQEETNDVSSINIHSQAWNDYLNILRPRMMMLMDEQGRMDVNVYLHSSEFENYPPALALWRAHREMEQLTKRAILEMETMNSLRLLAGLPPIQTNGEMGPMANRDMPEPNFGKDRSKEHRKEGDVRVLEKILSLLAPDSPVGLMTESPQNRQHHINLEMGWPELIKQYWWNRLNSALKDEVAPDMSLRTNEWSQVRGYLTSHINPERTQNNLADYLLMPNLAFSSRAAPVSLTLNKPIRAGLNSLMCPIGYKPVAYFLKEGYVELQISGLPHKGMYAFTTHEEIPGGLTFYYEKDPSVDNSSPTAAEKETQAVKYKLEPHWRNLIDALDASSLTPKQKLDILIRAWTRTFVYDDSQETFDLYHQFTDEWLTTGIINFAKGNCGYAETGLRGLATLVGIPTRSIASYLSNGYGNFSLSGNLHGMVQCYIDNRWVYVEPQAGYVDPQFAVEETPQEFEALIKAIPSHDLANLSAQLGLNRIAPLLRDGRPPIKDLAAATMEVIFQNLPVVRQVITRPLDTARLLSAQLQMSTGNRELLKRLLMWGATATAVTLPILIKVSQAFAAKEATALVLNFKPEPTATVAQVMEVATEKIHGSSYESLVPLILMGLGSFWLGRQVERRRAKTNQPISSETKAD